MCYCAKRVCDVISHDWFPFPESSVLGCDATFSMLLARIEDICVIVLKMRVCDVILQLISILQNVVCFFWSFEAVVTRHWRSITSLVSNSRCRSYMRLLRRRVFSSVLSLSNPTSADGTNQMSSLRSTCVSRFLAPGRLSGTTISRHFTTRSLFANSADTLSVARPLCVAHTKVASPIDLKSPRPERKSPRHESTTNRNALAGWDQDIGWMIGSLHWCCANCKRRCFEDVPYGFPSEIHHIRRYCSYLECGKFKEDLTSRRCFSAATLLYVSYCVWCFASVGVAGPRWATHWRWPLYCRQSFAQRRQPLKRRYQAFRRRRQAFRRRRQTLRRRRLALRRRRQAFRRRRQAFKQRWQMIRQRRQAFIRRC